MLSMYGLVPLVVGGVDVAGETDLDGPSTCGDTFSFNFGGPVDEDSVEKEKKSVYSRIFVQQEAYAFS